MNDLGKKFLIYSAAVITTVLLINYFFEFKLYNTDSRYFYGLAKYLAAGKFENSNIFWPVYPGGFALVLSLILFIVPKISYEFISILSLCSSLIVGFFIFTKAMQRLKFSFRENLFYFFFAISGFYVAEYIFGEILLPQVWGYLLFPLACFILFSKNYKLFLPFLAAMYFIHSPSAFFILLASTPLVFFREHRHRVLLISAAATPYLALKLLHFSLLFLGVSFDNLPLNHFLFFNISTNPTLLSGSHYSLPISQVMLSGVPLFFWILLLKPNFKKNPELIFYLSTILLFLGVMIFYEYWTDLFPLDWPRDRYLGFMWLSLGLCAAYIIPQVKFRKVFYAFATLFIVAQIGGAFYRETRTMEKDEEYLTWIEEIPSEQKTILFMTNGNISTYAYQRFSPGNIFFAIPCPNNEKTYINNRLGKALIDCNKHSSEYFEKFMTKNNVSLLVFSNEFEKDLAFAHSSPNYKLLSKFRNEIYAYEVITKE